MKCPVDDAPLCEVERGGFKPAACGCCHGLWITRDMLKQTFASRHPPQHFDAAELEPPRLAPTPSRARLCPGCNYQLAVRWLHGIQIDVCQKCHGIWLDAGELRQIVANYQRRNLVLAGAAAPMAGAAASDRPSRWYDGIDLPVVDLLAPLGETLGELASNGVDVAKPVLEFLGEALSLLDW